MPEILLLNGTVYWGRVIRIGLYYIMKLMKGAGHCLGTCDKRYYLGREVAKPGDHLVITGLLGGFPGAHLLIKGEDVYGRSDRESLLNILTDPTARINEGRYMEETRVATASCDLSDGLADALSHFCKDTIGITIDEASLPMRPLAREAAAKTLCKLHKLAFGAGDWAVAFTVPDKGMKLLQRGKYEGLRLSSIGQFNESGQKLIKRLDGTVERAPEFVNEQFVKRLEDERNYFELFY
ncbi:hypothetical protein SAMN05216315_101117 [Nitrosospira sp. Nsp18]|uniref:hypothetical protein n=1 Tax=Nitrosospira sp. Nsp18 TaxID=1855334 RepID=UPI00088BAF87|nr:hypothetical protein [Nitrosospira sp. Nsp18]SDA09801.1 hypothetical protein SAMN05216315_101117 [Nitrosospira sp. Nsp18]